MDICHRSADHYRSWDSDRCNCEPASSPLSSELFVLTLSTTAMNGERYVSVSETLTRLQYRYSSYTDCGHEDLDVGYIFGVHECTN